MVRFRAANTVTTDEPDPANMGVPAVPRPIHDSPVVRRHKQPVSEIMSRFLTSPFPLKLTGAGPGQASEHCLPDGESGCPATLPPEHDGARRAAMTIVAAVSRVRTEAVLVAMATYHSIR